MVEQEAFASKFLKRRYTEMESLNYRELGGIIEMQISNWRGAFRIGMLEDGHTWGNPNITWFQLICIQKHNDQTNASHDYQGIKQQSTVLPLVRFRRKAVNAIVSYIALVVICYASMSCAINQECKCKTVVYFMFNRTDTNTVLRTMLC